jgi:L-2-hydroxyglutarate oxidase LhgO
MNILVIGGGIFGTVISLVLSEDSNNCVTLVEQTDDILNKASKCNHNRLHFGFHYPRSIETANQSLTGMISFFVNFKEAINTSFDNYYLIEKNGKVTANQFIKFCEEM